MATTRLPAPARAPWPDARRSSSVHGCGLRAKPSAPTAVSSPSNGLRPSTCQVSPAPTEDGSTSSSTAPRHLVRRYAATPPSSPPSPVAARPYPEQRTMTLLPSPRRARENSGRTRSCSNEARSAYWSSPPSSAVAGAGSAANSCVSSLTIARAALPLRCDPLPATDGCDAGGGS